MSFVPACGLLVCPWRAEVRRAENRLTFESAELRWIDGGRSATRTSDAVFCASWPGRAPPQDPAFYRRVLDEAPGALVVVGPTGDVMYANGAMMALGNWTLDSIGGNILDSIHPHDAAWVAEAFVSLAATADQHTDPARNRWASVHLRMTSGDGDEIPVEVSGTGALLDPEIGGIIYHVRAARSQELLAKVLTGIATATPVEELLGGVIEIVATDPLDLDAAILSPTGLGDDEILVTTSDDLAEALRRAEGVTPWSEPAGQPTYVAVDDLPHEMAAALNVHGYRDLWHIAVESRVTSSTFRIIACSPTHHEPATGVINRLLRARELAAVVLLRSQTDVLLAHGAFHDHLTKLTNRAGLMNRMSDVGTRSDHGLIVLYIDLDGFKPINDEFGHDAGDHVLQVTAERLRDESRTNDLVARVGGDEFVVVLGRSDGRSAAHERARAAADRLVTAIGRPIDVGGIDVRVSASIGVVVSESENTIAQLLSRADHDMFEAKRAGGARGHLYEA